MGAEQLKTYVNFIAVAPSHVNSTEMSVEIKFKFTSHSPVHGVRYNNAVLQVKVFPMQSGDHWFRRLV